MRHLITLHFLTFLIKVNGVRPQLDSDEWRSLSEERLKLIWELEEQVVKLKGDLRRMELDVRCFIPNPHFLLSLIPGPA
jgi:hypothetical protein